MEMNYTQMSRSPFAQSGPRRRKSTNEQEINQSLHEMEAHLVAGQPRSSQVEQAQYSSHLEAKQSLVMNGRSVGRVYKPTLQEKIRRLLNGKPGLIIELLNLFFSLIAFGLYISELYGKELYASITVQSIELFLMCYFIFDLILHLVAAENPLKYLFSMYGLIDVVTIIPALVVHFLPNHDSQWILILRVLRIFRALRVLRLQQFLTMKKRGFDYELTVFILSIVATILCAAGVFQALEEPYYTANDQVITFHDSLYFVLVTISTVGYGDVSPKTIWSHFFVMGMIICMFTLIPRQVTRLNELAKEEHEYDKEYTTRHTSSSTTSTGSFWSFMSSCTTTSTTTSTSSSSSRSTTTTTTTGHVVVSGLDLTMETVRDFLTEFYHPTRGSILLDVIFMSDKIPSKALTRLLQNEKYREKTLYLRGNLTLQKDRHRVQLNHATAVFLLTKDKEYASVVEQKQVEATLLLQALSVRNHMSTTHGSSFSSSHHHHHRHHHVDLYLQQLTFNSHDALSSNEELVEEEDVTCFLLGANIMKTIPLKHAMLARASICPGAGVFLLNLIRSVDINVQYAKYRPLWNSGRTTTTVWLDEYIDGMCYQIYPIIFSKKFRGLLFEQVIEEMYTHYRAILIALHVKNRFTHGIELCPFGHVLQEGMIGFILAKSAAVGHMIVRTYGYWQEEVNEARSTRGGGGGLRGGAGGGPAGVGGQSQQAISTATTSATPGTTSGTDGLNIPMPSVQVSTDTLLKRSSPRARFRRGLSSPPPTAPSTAASTSSTSSASMTTASNITQERKQEHEEEDDDEENIRVVLTCDDQTQQQEQGHPNRQQGPRGPALPSRKSTLEEFEDYSEQKKIPKSEQELKDFLQDHTRLHVKGYRDHIVLCGRSFIVLMALVKLLRNFYQQEVKGTSSHTNSSSNNNTMAKGVIYPKAYVLLLSEMPLLQDVALYLEDQETQDDDNDDDNGEENGGHVVLVHGSADQTKDLIKVSAAHARRVVILPIDCSFGTGSLNDLDPVESCPDAERGNLDGTDESSMDDFGVIKAILALEMVQKLPHERNEQQKRLEPVRRRASGRLLSTYHLFEPKYPLSYIQEAGNGEDNGEKEEEEVNPRQDHGTYHRELTHGLPVDLVKIRMMERFPSVDPSVFTQSDDHHTIDTALQQQSHHYPQVQGEIDPVYPSSYDLVADSFGARKCVGVLQHARNLKYCRPRDAFFCRDELPFLSPAYACGNIFTTCMLDRIICQAFYNPYIMDVIQALAMGNNGFFLSQMAIPSYYIHGHFGSLFGHFLHKNTLVVALWRHPNELVHGNFLPYCMTCPSFDTILEPGDQVFVLKK